MQQLLDTRAQPRGPTPHASCCAIRAPATWAGWCSSTARSTAREYGYNSEFEALVADIAAKYIKNFDPAWEKGWIAEIDGERVGSVFVVRKSATVAQLRLLILTPEARGPRPGRAPHRRMHRLRARQGLPQDDAVDAEQPAAARAHLQVARLQVVKSEPSMPSGRTWSARPGS